jgi:hypothetical protein
VKRTQWKEFLSSLLEHKVRFGKPIQTYTFLLGMLESMMNWNLRWLSKKPESYPSKLLACPV